MESVGVEVRSRLRPVLSVEALTDEQHLCRLSQYSSENIAIDNHNGRITLACQIKSMMGTDDQHTGWQAS